MHKATKSRDKVRVLLAFFIENVLDAACDIRNVWRELLDGSLPFLVLWLAIGKEDLEQFNQFSPLVMSSFSPLSDAVLIKNGALGTLKDDVIEEIAKFQLLFDFLL